jgi:hypothetical protein
VHLGQVPNADRLMPKITHPAHDLFNGKLLELQGVRLEGGQTLVTICSKCVHKLRKSSDLPPPLSLANNLWIGKVPWQLQVLTFSEQLLIARLYPRVYVFKLFPKNREGGFNADQLQRGMHGTVSTYDLDIDGIASMIEGRLMPQSPAVLASVISVTFMGLGELPKCWLRSTFRVRRQSVFEALKWLKENNQKYYGDIDISTERIELLPEDDVPQEIFGVVRQSTDVGAVDEEHNGYVPNDDDGKA